MKDIRKSTLRALLPHMILQELSAGPTHGYQLKKCFYKKHNYNVGMSTLYPMLWTMEHDGLLGSMWQLTGKRPKKTYTITAKGRATLGKTSEIVMVLRMGLTNHMIEVKA